MQLLFDEVHKFEGNTVGGGMVMATAAHFPEYAELAGMGIFCVCADAHNPADAIATAKMPLNALFTSVLFI